MPLRNNVASGTLGMTSVLKFHVCLCGVPSLVPSLYSPLHFISFHFIYKVLLQSQYQSNTSLTLRLGVPGRENGLFGCFQGENRYFC